MGLEKYNEKRDFTATKEPKGGKSANKKLRFVVQRHHASHLHYDFRLELDGVLKSWAVPKGPSLNPKDKRLAMMVEDHPYDYKDFEGEIPKGNYGAGTVSIFDEGFYHSLADERKDDVKTLHAGLHSGNLKFSLNGKILKGEFALVRLKNAEDNSWLLIKHDDKYAEHKKFSAEDLVSEKIKKAGLAFKKAEKAPKVQAKQEVKAAKKAYEPMLATLASDIFDDEDWLFERKLDGYRILAENGEKLNLVTRNGKNYTDKYPSIAKELKKLKEDCVIDGELVAVDKKGKDVFQLLQHYEESKAELKYYAFDLLALDGHDLTELPLIQRKNLLEKLLEPYQFKNVLFNQHIIGKGKKAFKEAEREHWEGIIGKRANDTYYPGKRTQSWLKFKFNNSQEAIICGFTAPGGSRKRFGALVLGMLDDKEHIKYIGNCGTGFTDTDLEELYQKMEPLIMKSKPFKAKVAQERNATWIKPELVCEVTYTEWTNDGHLRHPVFKGLRTDKDKKSVKAELPKNAKKVAKQKHDFGGENDVEKTFGGKKVSLSNLDKLYWPKEKITKGDLIHYYDTVANEMLPYLKNKPLSLNRHPNGITKPGFFQKDVDTEHIPKWAKTTKVFSESNAKTIDYLVCNDKATLIYMANLGCIEINPWLSNYQKPEKPDFMVIDLDPDKNEFSEVVQLALVLKEVFDEMQIRSYVKTSGSSGIHIYVYVGAAYDYDFVKEFARFIAQKAHERSPDNTSLERSPSKRKGKIYIDFLQNRRGQTIAAPYSARPKPGATVSFPVDWEALDENFSMKDYDIFNVPEKIANRNDPWASIFDEKQDLKKALKGVKR
ncbi:DNA ligase D [Pelobium manganitolerans]|uniref:DNA ligase (ATP) n=1 Tax=Pelobium manganitolerans TaxID=1842495 RepID=A0A419S3D8_9SPHI|nr:DNA ligase D [Pelobium manganitolerans]RKD13812.1 DNA ligase D [Pelobium manganitolerans]